MRKGFLAAYSHNFPIFRSLGSSSYVAEGENVTISATTYINETFNIAKPLKYHADAT